MRLDPKIVTVWRTTDLIVFWVLALLLVGLGLLLRNTAGLWALGAAALVGIGGSIYALRFNPIAYQRWSYEIGDEALELRHGVLKRTHSVIPWFRVQHVDITCGPLERALGLRRLVMHTASAATDAKIPGIDESAAAELRRVILERAGQGDAV